MRRALAILVLVAWAAPAAAGTLVTGAILRGTSERFTCEVLNAGRWPVDVDIEIRAVTSPPPDFLVCGSETFRVVPGRIEGYEVQASDCGAAGLYYAVFTVHRAPRSTLRAWCTAQEDPTQRVEAR